MLYNDDGAHACAHSNEVFDACPWPAPHRPLGPEAVRAFAAAALNVLLAQLQPYPSAFEAAAGDAGEGAPVERGTHSPEGVPDALRKEAGAAQSRVVSRQGASRSLAWGGGGGGGQGPV